MSDPVTPEQAMHQALLLLGIPEDRHAAIIAAHDQIKAWEADHPGQDALLSGECDHLFMQMGRVARDVL